MVSYYSPPSLSLMDIKFERDQEYFGVFRAHRSMINLIWRVNMIQERIEDRLRNGGLVLAVSFNIANAFNSLPY